MTTPSTSTRAPSRHQAPGPRDFLDLDLGADVLELLLDRVGLVLRDRLLDRLGRRFNQILGLLQAKARDLANHLDDVDLVGAYFSQRDRELGLLLDCSRGS